MTLSISTFTDVRAVYAWYLDAALAHLDACDARAPAVAAVQLLLEARVGLSDGDLRQLIGNPQPRHNALWFLVRAMLRPLVVEFGGRLALGHDYVCAAAQTKVGGAGADIASEKIAKFFFAACRGAGQFPPIQARLRDERPHSRLLRLGMADVAAQLLSNGHYTGQLFPNGELR